MGRPRTVDIVGNQYSFLKVLDRSENYMQNRKWVCECVCGKICETTKHRLENGRAKSCGCMKSKLLSDASRIHGAYSGGKNSPEYQSYIAMMHRCYDDKRVGWGRYGGRGIIVSEDRWLEPGTGFLNFLDDMGSRPEGTSLDRIDVDGNYFKENCRWADRRTQAYNSDKGKKEIVHQNIGACLYLKTGVSLGWQESVMGTEDMNGWDNSPPKRKLHWLIIKGQLKSTEKMRY